MDMAQIPSEVILLMDIKKNKKQDFNSLKRSQRKESVGSFQVNLKVTLNG